MATRIADRCANDQRLLVRCPDPRIIAECGEVIEVSNICYTVSLNFASCFRGTLSNLDECNFAASGNIGILTNPPPGLQGCDPFVRSVRMADGFFCPYTGSEMPVCSDVQSDDQCVGWCNRIDNGFQVGRGRFRQSLRFRSDGGLEEAHYSGRQWMFYEKEIINDPPFGNVDYSTQCCYIYQDGVPLPDAQVPYASFLRFDDSQAALLPSGANICNHPEAYEYVGAVLIDVYLRPPANVRITDLSHNALAALLQDHPDWWSSDCTVDPRGPIFNGVHPGGHFGTQLVNVVAQPHTQEMSAGLNPFNSSEFVFESFDNAQATPPSVQFVPEGFPFPESTICLNTYYHSGNGDPPDFIAHWEGLREVARVQITPTGLP